MRPAPRLLMLALMLTALCAVLVLAWADATGWVMALWDGFAAVALADLLTSTPRKYLQLSVAVPKTGHCGAVVRLVAQVTTAKGVLPPGLVARLYIDPALGAAEMPPLARSTDNLRAATGADLHLSQRGVHAIRSVALKWRSKLGLFEIIDTWPLVLRWLP